MALKKAVEDLKFDCRMIKSHLRTQKITEEDYKKHLEQLPDCAHNAVALGGVESSVEDITPSHEPQGF